MRTVSINIDAIFNPIPCLCCCSNDLAFSVEGYTLITLNNFFTAANGVYIKKKLESKDFGKYGLMYYNALFMVVPAVLFAFLSGEIDKVS